MDEFPALLDDVESLVAEEGGVDHEAEFEGEEGEEGGLLLGLGALDDSAVVPADDGGVVGEGEPAFPWWEGVRYLDTLGCAGEDMGMDLARASVLGSSSSFSFCCFSLCMTLREGEEGKAPEERGQVEEFEEGADVRAGGGREGHDGRAMNWRELHYGR